MKRTMKLRIMDTVITTALTGVLLGTAQAQDTVSKGTVVKGRAPVAKDILRVKLPKAQEFTLKNGVRVFVLVDKRMPLFTVNLQMKAGNLLEPKPGLASLTAQMLNEGTKNLSADQIARETESLGATLDAGVNPEYTSVTVSGLTENEETLLGLMADVLLHPSFPDDQFSRLKSQTKSRLTQQRTDPNYLARELQSKTLYGNTPYARVSPTAEEVDSITTADLAAFHDTYYHPNGAILGIVGDVDPKQIVARLDSALADWKPAASEPAYPKADFAPISAGHIYLVDRPASAQTVLAFANIAITRTDPDFIPLRVANQILGGGSSGRLFQNLREDKGYTYGAYSQLATPRWAGTWGGGASVQTAVTTPAVGEFYKEFDRIQTEPVSEAELDRAKRAIVGAFALTLESPANVLSRTLEIVQYGLPADYWETYPAKIEAVTAADVRQVAAKYLGKNRLQLFAVGERTAIESGLAKYGTVTIFDAATGKEIPHTGGTN